MSGDSSFADSDTSFSGTIATRALEKNNESLKVFSTTLPIELLEMVTLHLDVKSVVYGGMVNSVWKIWLDSESVWTNLIHLDFDARDYRVQSISCKNIYKSMISESKRKALALKEATEAKNNWRCLASCGMRMRPFQMRKRPQPVNVIPFDTRWPKHPDSSPQLVLQFDFDLIESAKELYHMYHTISNQLGESKGFDPQLTAWLDRYSKFLRLKIKYPDAFLIPTLDIEFVWCSHMIRPSMYKDDLAKAGSSVIPHWLIGTPVDILCKTKAFEETCILWKEEYHERYCIVEPIDHIKQMAAKFDPGWVQSRHTGLDSKTEPSPVAQEIDLDCTIHKKAPFFVDGMLSAHIIQHDIKYLWVLSTLGYSLSPGGNTAVATQLTIDHLKEDLSWLDYFKASTSRKITQNFWTHTAKSYERFLYFCAKNPGLAMIHPPHVIDLFWHTHMVHPQFYEQDCRRYIGQFIDHIPDPDYKQENFDAGNQKWKEEFGVTLSDEPFTKWWEGFPYDTHWEGAFRRWY